jgi:hypothetical protein
LNYILYLKADGSLWGKGGTDYGIKFGNGESPAKVADGVTSASASSYHILFVKNDHTLWGMGSPLGGFGDSYSPTQFLNTPLQLDTGIQSAAANIAQNLMLRTARFGPVAWAGPAGAVRRCRWILA